MILIRLYSNRLDVPSLHNYFEGKDAFSFAAWIKADSVPQERGFFTGDLSNRNDDRWGIRYDDRGATGGREDTLKIGMAINGRTNTYQYEADAYTQTDQWQHVAFVWRSGHGPDLYLNGTLDTSSAISNNFGTVAGTLSNQPHFWIGDGAKNPWLGHMDDVAVWNEEVGAHALLDILPAALVDLVHRRDGDVEGGVLDQEVAGASELLVGSTVAVVRDLEVREAKRELRADKILRQMVTVSPGLASLGLTLRLETLNSAGLGATSSKSPSFVVWGTSLMSTFRILVSLSVRGAETGDSATTLKVMVQRVPLPPGKGSCHFPFSSGRIIVMKNTLLWPSGRVGSPMKSCFSTLSTPCSPLFTN